jgi:hypothetical protein
MTGNKRIFVLISFVLAIGVVSEAQWVAVAHAVSGRIQQMQQKNAQGTGGYDVAVVIIEARAQKVYETAVQRLEAHGSPIKVLKHDAKKRTVAFTDGALTASLQANPLGETITQLVVASTLDPTKPSTTSLVVKSIQQVCTELKVECTLEDQ